MKPSRLLVLVLALLPALLRAEEADHVSQYGITWTFDKAYPVGQFGSGDFWVVGPVRVTRVSTDLHAPGFAPKPGEDGSMVNPGTGDKQGYDCRLSSYDAKLNAALVNGKPISPENPLALPVNSSLVSMVSWLYRSESDAEPGTPKFNAGTKAPRPVTRSGAVLTVLPAPPPPNSFRPPYAGSDKAVKFTLDQLDRSKLKDLAPVANTPEPASLEKQVERPWIDHVYQYLGAMVHPSENMPNYGREIGRTLGEVALVLHLDFSKLPGSPKKDKLLAALVQQGIDYAGIADAGGGWPANGGHHLGRKLPILFAGVLLNDAHMKDVGRWKTRFQEDEQTFVVTQAEVDLTHGPKWKPDKRGGAPEPYEKKDLGMPEWGICHVEKPAADNRELAAPYRAINSGIYPGFVLAARLMGLEEAWNHKPLFDYADRWMGMDRAPSDPTNEACPFFAAMWKAYRGAIAPR
jgi:hypothetical protein